MRSFMLLPPLLLLPLFAACGREVEPAETAYAPNTQTGVADEMGVGVLDVDPTRDPYLVGPNPARRPRTAAEVRELRRPRTT